MNARETIAYHLWTAILSSDNAEAKATTEQMLDDYRAEILAEAKVETVAWLVKKAAEGYDVGGLASKVDRGAVRIFIGTAHYRDALDAHRAEVLNEAAGILRARAAQYPTRRVFAAGLRHGALALAKAAMGRGKSSREADATPEDGGRS
ncbi:hypothetical protein ACKI10_17615 [Streptomyces galilaeus]|uniref:Uncharacterized protein n=1 Tax=Streptomyces galilaeus TaxID=33899 RepID=A0ABW9IPN3_STRGJ